MKLFGHPLLLCSLLLFACLPLTAWSESTDKLRLITAETPGIAEKRPGREEPTGVGVEAVRQVFASAGVGLDVRLEPIARAYLSQKTSPGSCYAGMLRTTENEQAYIWLGPVARIRIIVYGRTGEASPVSSLSDLGNATIGVERGSSVARQIGSGGGNIEEASDTLTNLRKLLARRFDYMATTDLNLRAMLAGNEIELRGLSRSGQWPPVAPVLTLNQALLYIGCATDLSETLRKRLNMEFATAIKRGDFKPLGLVPGDSP